MSNLHALAKKYKKEIEELMSIYANFVDKINRLEVYKGHKMKANTLKKFQQLEKILTENGYETKISYTTKGDHDSPAHKYGDAIDFKIYKEGKPIESSESFQVEDICKNNGWLTYNEYVKKSRKWAGPHMHIVNPNKK